MSTLFFILAIVILIGVALHLRTKLAEARNYINAIIDENRDLRKLNGQVNEDRQRLVYELSQSKSAVNEKNGILKGLQDTLANMRKGVINDKEEAKPQPTVQVAAQEKPAAARRQAQVPQGASRVSGTHRRSDDTPMFVETPVYHHHHSSHSHHDGSFSRDSGVCEAPRHSSHSDTGSSYSYDSGSSSSDSGSSGGCD